MSTPISPSMSSGLSLYSGPCLVACISTDGLIFDRNLTARELKTVHPKADLAFAAFQRYSATPDKSAERFSKMVQNAVRGVIDLDDVREADVQEIVLLVAVAMAAARIAEEG